MTRYSYDAYIRSNQNKAQTIGPNEEDKGGLVMSVDIDEDTVDYTGWDLPEEPADFSHSNCANGECGQC